MNAILTVLGSAGAEEIVNATMFNVGDGNGIWYLIGAALVFFMQAGTLSLHDALPISGGLRDGGNGYDACEKRRKHHNEEPYGFLYRHGDVRAYRFRAYAR